MANHELAMMLYARLARVSHEKQQAAGRDRFLALAAREACLGGFLETGERCRDLVIASNPRHLLARADGIGDALRNDEVATWLKTLDRFCSFEQAEHLLAEMNLLPDAGDDPAAVAGAEINSISISEPAL